MSVLNANCLAIYYHGSGSTSKYDVIDDYTSTSLAASGVSSDQTSVIIVNTDGSTFLGFGDIDATADTFTSTTLTLAAAATSSTLDLTTTVEDVARDGSGGTLQETEVEWSISADGLVQSSDDSGEDLLDLARDKKYVMLKFEIDDIEYYGQALIDSVSVTGTVDEIATYSVSLTGVNDLYKA